MEEQEKGLSTCGTSESAVTGDGKVGGETLEGSVGCESQVQMEGSFSEELVGEGGACNGKDVMVEVLGSDVYIDGVCTHGSDTELNDEVVGSGGFGGGGESVDGGEGLSKDVKPGGVVGSGADTWLENSPAVESEEGKGENVAMELGREEGDNSLGCQLTGSSVGGENVQTEKDNQKEGNLVDNGAPGDRNEGDEKNIGNVQSDKLLEKEACVTISDDIDAKEKLNSEAEQPMEIDKVDDNSSNVLVEVVGGTEVAVDKALPNSEETHCVSFDKSTEKELMTHTSLVNSDTGQEIVEKDSAREVELNKNVSNAEECEMVEVEAKDEPGTKRMKTMNHTSKVEGEDTQFTDQDTGKEELHDESNIVQNVEVQAGISEQVGSNGGQEIKVEEFNEAEQRRKGGKVTKLAITKPEHLEIIHQARYLLPREEEGEFCVSDMVWGKVRSHPWWPGQIFDPSDSSEKAMKHYKKDCYLVAFFGDRTFAWNDETQLRHFRTYFSSIERQSMTESFQNAVDCALDEVTRRVEYGLACSCTPKDTYDPIKVQRVENTGIRPDLSFRLGVDESLNANTFSPDELIEYLKTLSALPTAGFDRLELVIAKAQLLSFYRFKGYSCLPELEYCSAWDDDDTLVHNDKKSGAVIDYATPVNKNAGQDGVENLKNQISSRRKRKHNLKDIMHSTKKRSLSELMGGTDGDDWSNDKVTDNLVSPGYSKKRRTIDHYADDSDSRVQDGRKTISVAKVSTTTKPSFKIGDCIRRVASKLTASPSMKYSSDRSQTDGNAGGFSGNGSDLSIQNFEEAQKSSVVVPSEYSSLDDLLSSLQRVAQEPLGDFSFLNAIVSFFSDFRNSITVIDDSVKEIFLSDKVGSKRKKPAIAGTPETFEFEDMSDTYWTDRVIDNGSEEQPALPSQPSQPPRKYRKKDYQLALSEPGKPVQVSRRPYSRKQYSNSNHVVAPEKPPGYIDENAPAELVMNFAELDSVPSETNLNKMFRRFGPLKESETEVDIVSSRARVVFKKCADAEVACSSAQKFNIFGPILVNYQLNYTPSALFKAPSVATTQDQEMHLDLSNFEINMV